MKILVVEDSSSMRAYLATIIEGGTESYDLEIVEAASGFEALKTLPHHRFDAILTDINMPDINGLELGQFWWILLLVAAAAIAGALFFLVRRRSQTGSKPSPAAPTAKESEAIVEDVFLLNHKDGLLIKHETRRLRPDVDTDILSGMLTAVQAFVKDALRGQYADSAVSATWALVTSSRWDEVRPTRFAMSWRERREALSTLREAFGHSIAKGPLPGQTQVEAGAATLAWFLTQDLDPVAHPRPIGITFLFTSFLVAGYLLFYSLARATSLLRD